MMRRLIVFAALLVLFVATAHAAKVQPDVDWASNVSFKCGNGCLWQYSSRTGGALKFPPPVFEIDGQRVEASVKEMKQKQATVQLRNGATESYFEGPLANVAGVTLGLQVQASGDNPVVRFRYVLKGNLTHHLTKRDGKDDAVYFGISLAEMPQAMEVKLANFVELSHSYELTETPLRPADFADDVQYSGPILAATNGQHSMLLAYEHGSPTPDDFLAFKLSADVGVRLIALRGNYSNGEPFDGDHPWNTIWFNVATTAGGYDELASAYRQFVLKYMSQNMATRKPQIYYNTWNFQERNKWQNGQPYLASMNEDRMLKEIEVAHKLGIDVFVLDTGWYGKTGDWDVSHERFMRGLAPLKAKLDEYGMKLGLWFGPQEAAISSRVMKEHPEWRMSQDGKIGEPAEVWETERSYWMCLASPFSDALADELIRLNRETGVTYFKWDAVGMYGCTDAHHWHGTEQNSVAERNDRYGFEMIRQMTRIAEKVGAAVPDAVVDFDVTEAGRAFGLGFLAGGRYFLMNNGPYYGSFDVPFDEAKTNPNLFFSKGPARTWIARSPLGFDRWIPSVLFLTHYLPDDPIESQEVNVASLILGQNGIWGDLLNLSPKGVDYIGGVIGRYKQVRDAITESDPVVTGPVGGSPEIHEKISAVTGRGAVVIFATTPGHYSYVTAHKVAAKHWANGDVTVSRGFEGRAKLELTFDRPGAKMVFFGVE